MITVHLPPDLVAEFKTQDVLTVQASTCAELLRALDVDHPGMAAWLAEANGRFRQHLSVFVSGRRLPPQSHLAAPIPDHSDVWILRAISGG